MIDRLRELIALISQLKFAVKSCDFCVKSSRKMYSLRKFTKIAQTGQCQLISSFKSQNQAIPVALREEIQIPPTIEELNDLKPEISSKTLTLNTMNENIIRMAHVVRGALTDRAGQLDKEIKSVWTGCKWADRNVQSIWRWFVVCLFQGMQKSFPCVINAHIGDCHSMGQPYITFLRQVINYS